MRGGRRGHRYTYPQYVAVERESRTKHEFLDGEIYAMAGGTEDHSAISALAISALVNAVGDRPCKVHTSDLRIYVESPGLATFPDAAVICGPLVQHAPSPETTALNPMILVEVTSDSSEEYDRVTKLDCYRTIPSLREYVVVSHRERCITVFARDASGEWTTSLSRAGGSVRLPSLDAALFVDAIYRTSGVR